MMINKTRILMPVCIHPIQAKIYQGIKDKKIGNWMSLRDIGEYIGEGNSPQKIKHHLDALVKFGTIDIVNGTYNLVIKSPDGSHI